MFAEVFDLLTMNEYTRLRFAVPPSGGVTPPEGGTTNWPRVPAAARGGLTNPPAAAGSDLSIRTGQERVRFLLRHADNERCLEFI
ncbi:hypothetical protein QUF80_07720 [Desulfococcaceae bacterium HSG8]|nr:hypothetical protein [Desulfococcaceae bacterium HSG8]